MEHEDAPHGATRCGLEGASRGLQAVYSGGGGEPAPPPEQISRLLGALVLSQLVLWAWATRMHAGRHAHTALPWLTASLAATHRSSGPPARSGLPLWAPEESPRRVDAEAGLRQRSDACLKVADVTVL